MIKSIIYAIGSTVSTSYTTPADFSSLVYVAALGSGGNGFSSNAVAAGGGGGGAFAKSTTVTGLSPGSTFYVSLGAPGSGDAWFNSSANTAPASATQGVLAKGGSSATSGTGGLGGQAASCVGTTVYSGGNGGSATFVGSCGGGGSAAGPNGAGGNGGNGYGAANSSGGGGGAAECFYGGITSSNGSTPTSSTVGGFGGAQLGQLRSMRYYDASLSTYRVVSASEGGGGMGGSQALSAPSNQSATGQQGQSAYAIPYYADVGNNLYITPVLCGGGGGGGCRGSNGGAGGGYSGGGGGGGGATGGSGAYGWVVLVYNSSSTSNTRYWVGGTGTWNNTTTHWSASSGGASGASVPTQYDNVVFDNNSGSGYTVTIPANSGVGSGLCNNLTISGTNAVTFSPSSGGYFQVLGNVSVTNPNATTSGTSARMFGPNILGSVSLTNASSTFTASTGNAINLTVLDSSGSVPSLSSPGTIINLQNGGTYTGTTLGLAPTCTLNATNVTFTFNPTATPSYSGYPLFPNNSYPYIALGNVAASAQANGWYPDSTWFGTLNGSATLNLSVTTSVGTASNEKDIWGFSNLSLNFTSSTNSAAYSLGGAFNNLNFTGLTSTIGIITGSSTNLDVYGDFTTPSTLTWSWGQSYFLRFRKSSGTQNITTNGLALGCNVTFGESSSTTGTTFLLADNFSQSTSLGSAFSAELIAGTFNANNRNVSVPRFLSKNSNTRTITMGSGTWTLNTGFYQSGVTQASWDLSTTTNLTFNANTSNIVWNGAYTSTDTKAFLGGGLTYNNLTISGGTGIATYIFSGNNTFSTISYTKTVAGTFQFTSGSTTTVSTWSVNGTSSAPITINSTSAGSQATLVKSGAGTINMSYTSIQDSNATPSNTWYAYLTNNNTNLGNNTGWIFSASVQSGNFLMFF